MKNIAYLHQSITGVYIPLSYKGRPLVVWFDRDDFTKVSSIGGTWGVKWNPTAQTFYCKVQIGGRKNKQNVYMHRFILGVTDASIQVDHLDHNGLNNRRENIKVATVMENGSNRRGPQYNSLSQRLNVYWNRREQKWMVWLVYLGKRYYAGYFTDLDKADEAAKALRESVRAG